MHVLAYRRAYLHIQTHIDQVRAWGSKFMDLLTQKGKQLRYTISLIKLVVPILSLKYG